MNILKPIIFHLLHGLLYLQTGALFLMGLAPVPGIMFVGILLAVPGILILNKTIPRLTQIHRESQAIIALGITLIPLVLLIFAVAIELTTQSPLSAPQASSGDYSTTTLLLLAVVLPTSIIGLRLIASLIKRLPEPSSRSTKETTSRTLNHPPTSIASDPQKTTALLKKVLLVAFLTLMAFSFVTALIRAIIEAV